MLLASVYDNPIRSSGKCKYVTTHARDSQESIYCGDGQGKMGISCTLSSKALLSGETWKEVRMWDMTGGNQAKVRVQLKYNLTLFPQGAVVTD